MRQSAPTQSLPSGALPRTPCNGIGQVRRCTTVVSITLDNGSQHRGHSFEVDWKKAVVQRFEKTTGIDNLSTHVDFWGNIMKILVLTDMPGCLFKGSGESIDKDPASSLKTILMSPVQAQNLKVVSTQEK